MKDKLRLGILLLLAVACGDDDRPETVAPGSGGTAGSFNSGGSGGSGGSSGASGGSGGSSDGGDGPTASGAPVVTITRPDALDHPNDGEVIVDDQVEVTCRVTKSSEPGSQPVNAASVMLTAHDAAGNVVDQVSGQPLTPNEYRGSLVISSVSNGVVQFGCSASDTSDPPLVGTDRVSTFVDHGPLINVTSPLPDSAHALIGAVRFEFTVEPAPLADGDDGAAIDEVELDVNGIPIAATNVDGYSWAADVNLNDPLVFPTTPAGAVPVVIRASNVRTPIAGETFVSYSFLVDGRGPVIQISSHEDEDIIPGQDTLVFTVTDDHVGVDPQTVVVTLNGVKHRYDPTDPNWSYQIEDGRFTFRIDSRNIAGSISQITILIEAEDNVGNRSDGTSLTLYLDEFPPIVDLDPGNVREIRRDGPDHVCSDSFDPLGTAPNDLDTVVDFILPRALVWDLTNSAPGQIWHYLSGADSQRVHLYLKDQTSVPLIVDTDSDGICDDIDRSLVLPYQVLRPVAPGGTPPEQGNSTEPPLAVFSPPAELDEADCKLQARELPRPLCNGESDLTRVIGHGVAFSEESVVYAKGSLNDPECTGGQWEITPHVDEGWICLAAVAYDNVGNRGVSAPLRLCYDSPLQPGTPACVTDKSNPPTCRANCTAPPRFEPSFIVVR